MTQFIKMAMSQKLYKAETQLQWMTNRLSYLLYQTALLPVTVSDIEGHFDSFKDFEFQQLNLYSLIIWHSCVSYGAERVLCATTQFLVLLLFVCHRISTLHVPEISYNSSL